MILGIGVDIIHLPRIYALITRNFPRQFKRFVTRILDSDEIKEFYSIFPIYNEGDNMVIENYNHPIVRYLAVRWSIKEAAYKALYPNYKATWKDLKTTFVHSQKC
ncbi:9195_t:CDS:2 [Diversispora eburnea]|uniref:9195_t:CDS:1 n=1 Tax=Diversispora eburnea TaxID=1213867 RepID=A0A9N8YSL3_9GLOM|nr:9195_t:CDS:2 [Diversispora eburnea]